MGGWRQGLRVARREPLAESGALLARPFCECRRVARFSVLDFWGNRSDVDVPVERISPPFRNRSVAEVRTGIWLTATAGKCRGVDPQGEW